MPPRRTTRQSAASTADGEPTPTPAPAPVKRTRAPASRAVEEPAEESADELDMEEPVKPARRTRAPAKASTATSIPKESKAAATKRTATKPPAKTKASTAPAAKAKSTVNRKVKEVVPITESENEEDAEEQDPLAAHELEEVTKAVPKMASESYEELKHAAVPTSEDDEDDEPTIRRAPSSAQAVTESQPPLSSRRTSIPIVMPAQTEDDALDVLLSQSQHRSTHIPRSNSQLSVPATPLAPRTIPQTPAPQTARTRIVPGTAQGTAMKGKSSFLQTPGGVGRTPGASQSQQRVDGRDAKPVVVAPKKRLVIHKLVLVDFKSYAGRQEIGPFHKVSLPFDD
jgi:structural maintenance of chromosome 4